MSDPPSSGILRGLRSRNPRKAWAAFLEAYSPVILDVIRLFERDEDAAGNCYLFVCERLCRDRFRRLRRPRLVARRGSIAIAARFALRAIAVSDRS